MKYLIFSDIHGSMYYWEKAVKVIERENPDKIILLGDLYYHGPRNPLPRGYNPKAVAESMNGYRDKIIAIRGNCDAEVDQMISDFKFKESYKIKINNKLVMFTHGHKYNKDNLPLGVDVLIYGHFHTGFICKEGEVVAINSGSISLPKNNTKHSFLSMSDNIINLVDLCSGKILDSIEI